MSIAKIFLTYTIRIACLERLKLMPFYKRIRDLREDRDLTQTQMGKILSCSQRVYSNYERGDIDIPTSTLIKLAEYHNVSVDYILDRTDKKETNK